MTRYAWSLPRITTDNVTVRTLPRAVCLAASSQVSSRVSIAVLALAVAACGSATPDRSTTGARASTQDESAASVARGAPAASESADGDQAVDPCTLLTDAEIRQHTGFPVGGKDSQAGGGGFFAPTCLWTLDTGATTRGLHTITVAVSTPGGRARFNALSSVPRLAGLGDDAAKMGGNTAGTIWTVSGDALVKVDYSLPVTVADADPLVVPLAQAVLSGLRSGAPASVTLGPDYTSNVILGFAATAARGHGTRGRNATNVCVKLESKL